MSLTCWVELKVQAPPDSRVQGLLIAQLFTLLSLIAPWGGEGRRGERVGKGHGEQVEVQAPHFTFAG